MTTYTTKNAAETEALAKELLAEILIKKVIQLSGNLGSGKTTFVKGLAKALGIEQAIKSPTYTYVNRYGIKERGNEEKGVGLNLSSFPRSLVHYDLYRLPETSSDPHQTSASIGLEDALQDPTSIVVIEWPERLPFYIPSLHLSFDKMENSHQIKVNQERKS
jgi:tRNA threonylcarbamoyladenosine biosynthesis protein TsaE